jgi:hypothetical protein
MISEELKVQIIHLRATGFSHENISRKLGLSKQTIINTSNDMIQEIEHQKELIRSESLKALSISRVKAISSTSDLLNNLCLEVANRSFEDIKTEHLINLFLKTIQSINQTQQEQSTKIGQSKLIIKFD